MKMIFHKAAILLIQLFVFGIVQSNAQIVRPIGTNLSGIEDWSSEYVFVDAFNQCRDWIPHAIGSGAPWTSGVSIPLRTDGYPLEIPYENGIDPPQAIRTLLFFGSLDGRYPSGNYRLIASGTGKIRLRFAANGTFTCPVDTMISVNSSVGGIALEIDTSLASDPVRDIHFVMPGFENTFTTNPYHPDLLSFVKDFQVIRFMDWMKTNGSPNTTWSNRNLTNNFTQTLDNGVAYEHIINICNLTQKHPWVCIPHRADDTFISELAKLFRDSLDPGLKLYVEYSNEVWNTGFSQSRYADSMGNALGYSGNPWEQRWQFYAKRTADVMQIFETEFSGNNRLVKVIASQSANSWLTNYIIEKFNDVKYNSSQVKADVIAIAPYFGGSIANVIGDAGLINSVSVNDILDSMEKSLPQAFAWMDATKTVADNHNLELMAYEGGQHLVANPTYYNDTAYVNKLKNANRHPRMKDLYCDYFNYWFDSTQAGMFCHFSSHGIYSKYGSWGVKEFMDDTLSPKYIGLQDCVFRYNIDTTTVGINKIVKENQSIIIYPVPSANGIINVKHSLTAPTIYLYDNMGRSINFRIDKYNEKGLTLNVQGYTGFAILRLNEKDVFIGKKILIID
ncbi:MAG: hypothetical protein ACI8SE_000753 [Bacteroidia bacterium]|jgi:hypothetical protein